MCERTRTCTCTRARAREIFWEKMCEDVKIYDLLMKICDL